MTTNLILNIFVDGYLIGLDAQHKELDINLLKTHLQRITDDQEAIQRVLNTVQQ